MATLCPWVLSTYCSVRSPIVGASSNDSSMEKADMSTYETPAITEIGSVAEFTQGAGSNLHYDGGLDFWGTRSTS